jgi:ferredoxin-like protein FixX
MRYTITLELPDDAHCPTCLKLIDIDEDNLELAIGECAECGEQISVTPDSGFMTWSVGQ